jgi:hypothetical protein
LPFFSHRKAKSDDNIGSKHRQQPSATIGKPCLKGMPAGLVSIGYPQLMS